MSAPSRQVDIILRRLPGPCWLTDAVLPGAAVESRTKRPCMWQPRPTAIPESFPAPSGIPAIELASASSGMVALSGKYVRNPQYAAATAAASADAPAGALSSPGMERNRQLRH